MVLPMVINTSLPETSFLNRRRARTAFNSRLLICSMLSGTVHPSGHVTFYVSTSPLFGGIHEDLKGWSSGCKACPDNTLSLSSHHLKGGWMDVGIEIRFSGGSGTLQWFFKCHWIGLMRSVPRWTCFSVAVKRPTRDIQCLNLQPCDLNRVVTRDLDQ